MILDDLVYQGWKIEIEQNSIGRVVLNASFGGESLFWVEAFSIDEAIEDLDEQVSEVLYPDPSGYLEEVD